LLSREKGWEQVEQAISVGAAISTVNVAEVVSKLSNAGMPETTIGQVLDLLGLEIVDFNRSLAHHTGMLRPHTSIWVYRLETVPVWLWPELAICLRLRQIRVWENLRLDVTIQMIR